MGQLPVEEQAGSPDQCPTAPASTSPNRLQIEPIDPAITSIQPGGGVCMRLELAWGRCRRRYLKTFRRGYLARMRQLRRGELHGCPHEILDPRDVKFYRNQGEDCWAAEDDPFTWRDRLPFVRAGLAELLILGGAFLALTVVLAVAWWPAAWVPAIPALLVVWFFRNPRRVAPGEIGQVVAPADGRVVSIDEVPHDDFIGGPAVVIGIFLSIFNVHVNRMPVAARVIGLTYRRGKFLNAMRPASARQNEQIAVRLEESSPPYRRMIVRQIAGAVARRIVCWARPGEDFGRGASFGMIKLGSRTELVLPRQPGLTVEVKRGQKVKAGASVLARY